MGIDRLKAMEERAMSLAEQGLNRDVSSIDAKELGEIIDVVKDLAEAKYYCSIYKAMEESEEADKYMRKYLPEMSYTRDYDERYYTIGRGGRPSRVRYSGSRYYNGSGGSSGGNGGNSNNSGGYSSGGRRNYYNPQMYYMNDDMFEEYHDEYDGDSWKYRRNYMESKHEHGDNNDSSKELNEYVKSLTDDIMDMVEKATPQEKNILKQKISTLATKIG